MIIRIKNSPVFSNESGGAALEYIIVSAVGLVLALSASAFIVSTFKDKVAMIADRLEVDTPDIELPF